MHILYLIHTKTAALNAAKDQWNEYDVTCRCVRWRRRSSRPRSTARNEKAFVQDTLRCSWFTVCYCYALQSIAVINSRRIGKDKVPHWTSLLQTNNCILAARVGKCPNIFTTNNHVINRVNLGISTAQCTYWIFKHVMGQIYSPRTIAIACGRLYLQTGVWSAKAAHGLSLISSLGDSTNSHRMIIIRQTEMLTM